MEIAKECMTMNMNIKAAFDQGLYDVARRDFTKPSGKTEKKPETQKNTKAEAAKSKAGAGAGISQANENKLSVKAQDLLKKLREKYGDYDFFVGNSDEEFDKLSNCGSKEFSVLISSDELEKMAEDESYSDEKMGQVEEAIKQCRKICEENGYSTSDSDEPGENGVVNKISVTIGADGSMKFFAELEKSSGRQKERIEKAKEKKEEEKKAKEKKEEAKEKAEKLKPANNPYAKVQKPSVKRVTVEAGSADELLEKIKAIDWNSVQAAKSGSFSLSV